MQSNEEYLDNLLKAAMENEEETKQPEKETADPNKALSPEEIAAMFADADGAQEEVVDPNKALSPEEIAAMFAGVDGVQEEANADMPAEEVQEEVSIEDLLAGTEEMEAVEEQPEKEEVDPNKALSPEEIAAMFAGTDGVQEEANADMPAEEVQEEVSIEDLLAGTEEMEAVEEQPEKEEVDPNKALSPEEIAAMFAETDEVQEEANADMLAEEIQEEANADMPVEEMQEEVSIEDLLAETEQIEEQPEIMEADSEESLEALLAELGNAEGVPEELLIGPDNEEEPVADFSGLESGDIAGASWDDLTGEDDEMAEINELLSQSESGSMLDDDMLALLENMPESGGSPQTEHTNGGETDEIDIFAMDAMDEEEEESHRQDLPEQAAEPSAEEKPEKKKEKKEKKEKKGWFGKGKKKKAQESEESKKENAEELSGIELTEEGLLDLAAINEAGEIGEKDEIREKEPKKSGFFSNLMDFLMEEEEEEEEEPKPEKKNKKEKKGKKKAKSGNGPASEENEAILDELEEEDKKNKKKKKPKKVKKQPKEKNQEEPSKEDGKKLPKKMVIRIFVMCFSVMILLIIPAMLLPEVFSLRDARKAYYNEDYKTAYENLLGKSLNSSDSLLLEKATILMRLQRKYDSFVNYHKMGKETEALNALLEGCSLYIQLEPQAQEQGISNELSQIRQDLLDNLEYLYGVTEDQAGVLISIEDDAVYTEEVERIAGSNDEITGGSIPAYRSDESGKTEE
ncbi:MAG: hypothetical protein NC412_06790 [Roseburia sp.]|nr:hypothetical protein [Roseburia sp.]MCM1277472.1 hypothetical protein [Robinsoniella sp.]